jgi:hypothetical protein
MNQYLQTILYFIRHAKNLLPENKNFLTKGIVKAPVEELVVEIKEGEDSEFIIQLPIF